MHSVFRPKQADDGEALRAELASVSGVDYRLCGLRASAMRGHPGKRRQDTRSSKADEKAPPVALTLPPRRARTGGGMRAALAAAEEDEEDRRLMMKRRAAREGVKGPADARPRPEPRSRVRDTRATTHVSATPLQTLGPSTMPASTAGEPLATGTLTAMLTAAGVDVGSPS